jgi:hypothetical protein
MLASQNPVFAAPWRRSSSFPPPCTADFSSIQAGYRTSRAHRASFRSARRAEIAAVLDRKGVSAMTTVGAIAVQPLQFLGETAPRERVYGCYPIGSRERRVRIGPHRSMVLAVENPSRPDRMPGASSDRSAGRHAGCGSRMGLFEQFARFFRLEEIISLLTWVVPCRWTLSSGGSGYNEPRSSSRPT